MNRLSSARAAVLTVVSGLALVLAATPAVAAPTITVTGVVTDEGGTPLEGISVYGWTESMGSGDEDDEGFLDGSEADLGDTDAEGRFTFTTRVGAAAEWGYGFTTDEPWTFSIEDLDPATPARFAPRRVTQTLTTGRNDLGTLQLEAGASIDGTLKTPSGRAIKGATVFTGRGTDVVRDAEAGDDTAADGAFRLDGLLAGVYRYGVYFEDDEWENEPVPLPGVTTSVEKAGAVTGVALTSKVPCTRGVTVTSPSRRAVRIVVRSHAIPFLTVPGGKVTIKRGTKTLATRTLSSTSTLTTLTFGSQPGGRQSYRVSYASGDCSGWSALTRAVTVK